MVKYAPDFQCQVFFNSLLYAFDWPLTLHIAYIHYGCFLTHIVWSFDLMAWNNTSRQQYSCVVWLVWRSYQHGMLVCLHQAWKKIFPVTNWWNDSGLLQWTQSWTELRLLDCPQRYFLMADQEQLYLIWIMCQKSYKDQYIPSWTGYNICKEAVK